MNYGKEFLVKPGSKVKLKGIVPDYADPDISKKQAEKELDKLRKRLWDLQYKLYSENRRCMLICLQAMDTGGKDGTIRHVFGNLNPMGCKVISFKKPDAASLSRDFLWRVHKEVPAKGEVVIFNRSQYEDVLVVRVHKMVPEEELARRYEQINNFESYLAFHDTQILKFFLHISKEEQLVRFKKRLDDPAANWKISEADYKERAYWDDYQKAYEVALARCSTSIAPWYVVPADKKWFRNLVIARIVVETMEKIDFQLPVPTVDLEQIRKQYHAAAEVAAADNGKHP